MQKRKPLREFEGQILQTRIALVLAFPNCFVPKKMPKRPLKIGIMKDLLASAREHYPQISKSMLRRFLFDYCSGNNYLIALRAGAARVDLSGSLAGFVTKEEAKNASERLAALVKKQKAGEKNRKKIPYNFRMVTTPADPVESARQELNRLIVADNQAEMSDSRYYTSGRKATMKTEIAEARRRLAEAEAGAKK